VMRKYHPTGPQPQLPVWGPPGAAGRMARAYDLDEDPGMTKEYEFRDYPDGDFTVGPFTVSAREVYHPVTAFALRVSVDGRTLVYSGDTAPCDALSEQAAGADVFLCEASFLSGHDEPPGIHLTGAEAGEVAAGAAVGRLLLTHIPPWYDPQTVLAEAMGTFSGPLELARTGHVYDVCRRFRRARGRPGPASAPEPRLSSRHDQPPARGRPCRRRAPSDYLDPALAGPPRRVGSPWGSAH